MANAPAKEQLKLLDIAELDKTISKLDRKNEKHPLRQELGTLINASAARARDKQAAQGRRRRNGPLRHEAEHTSAALRGQIEDKEAKLNSGVGLTSRDLLVLQDEIAGLRGMLDEASEAEFAALDGVEEAVDLATGSLSAPRSSLHEPTTTPRDQTRTGREPPAPQRDDLPHSTPTMALPPA